MTASWARRTLAAATSFMASVIFCVLPTDLMRVPSSLVLAAITCGAGRVIRRVSTPRLLHLALSRLPDPAATSPHATALTTPSLNAAGSIWPGSGDLGSWMPESDGCRSNMRLMAITAQQVAAAGLVQQPTLLGHMRTGNAAALRAAGSSVP